MRSVSGTYLSCLLPLSVIVFVCTSFNAAAAASAGDHEGATAAAKKAVDPEEWLNYIREDRFMRKRGGGPADPRNLFASIYGNYDQNVGYVIS